MIGTIIGAIVVGLIVGALARLVMPGKQNIGVVMTVLLGAVGSFLGTWVAYKLYEVFEDSQLAEFSARTVHLEESHQVLSRRSDQTQYQYFRSHHEQVDRGMREMFSSSLIRKKKMKETGR